MVEYQVELASGINYHIKYAQEYDRTSKPVHTVHTVQTNGHTFRNREETMGSLTNLQVCHSLTMYKWDKFDHRYLLKYNVYENVSLECHLFLYLNHLVMQSCLIF